METETRDREERREGRFARDGDGDDSEGLQRRTYRTLDEQEGRLSEAERRFERRRRTIGLFLGPIVFAVMLLIPFDLDGNQHPPPPEGDSSVDVVFGLFTDDTIFLFIGSFIIAQAR